MVPIFSENGEIFAHYEKKSMLNETASQEKQFKFLSIYLGVPASGKSPKIALKFRISQVQKKVKVFS